MSKTAEQIVADTRYVLEGLPQTEPADMRLAIHFDGTRDELIAEMRRAVVEIYGEDRADEIMVTMRVED